MKIISWNVGGLRAAWGRGLTTLIDEEQADIYAFQETRVTAPYKPAELSGYDAFWSISRHKKGYSGTLCLTKAHPLSVATDMGEDADFDLEGRIITLEYPDFYFVNVYVPNSQGSGMRYDYRCAWDEKFLHYIQRLQAEKPVIAVGDFNAAISDDDIYPESQFIERNARGYMTTERESLINLIDSGMVDSFRFLHPDARGQYSWWANRNHKRLENKGWRLDYAFVSEEISDKITESTLLTEVKGSDHCPVYLEMALALETAPADVHFGGGKRIKELMATDRDKLAKEMSHKDLAFVWKYYDWEAAEKHLAEMQRALALAAKARDMSEIKRRQAAIVHALDAKALAVRHICTAGTSPGIDGVMWKTPREKMSAVLALTAKDYRPKPSRMVVIKSKGGKQRRIHLETWYDRAMQTLYAMALDPVAEAWADRKSFAFRRGRSTYDLNEYIKVAFDGVHMPDYALIADVRQCYEHISHRWILNNIPLPKAILRAFLTAGHLFCGKLFPVSSAGIGIGLALSPIIANMTLDGLQDEIYEKLYPLRRGEIDYYGGNVLRYADDIIVAARSPEQAEKIKAILADFLSVRGLELSPHKTQVVDVRDGFTFMSRTYVKKHEHIRVYPSETAVSRFMATLKDTVENHIGSQQSLINRLNRKLSGWATYHRVSDAAETFRKVDVYLKALLLDSCRRMHPKWATAKLISKYWYQEKNGLYVYALPDRREVRVRPLSETLLINHHKVWTNLNPYIDTEYVERRTEERAIQNITGMWRGIWNRQNGRCYYCGKPIMKDQEKCIVEAHPEHSRKASRFAYVHMRCMDAGFESYESDNLPDSARELALLLNSLKQEQRPRGQHYLPLYEYFRTATKSPLTLTFDEMERICGRKFGKQRNRKDFWCRTGFLRITDAWLKNGYRIAHLHMDEEYVVFRRVDKLTAAVDIPDVFLKRRVPTEAKRELEAYFDYIKKKYGL